MLLRGAFRRCPWCGGKGAFFSSYYRKEDHCLTCGLRWRRDDVGYELGAAAMAAIITLGPLMLLLLALVVVTWPEIEVVMMFIVLGVGALVLPFFTYPRAYIMWQAVDIVMRPVEPGDFDPEVHAENDRSRDVRSGDA